MAIWGPLISAGSSLLGGFLNRREAKQQTGDGQFWNRFDADRAFDASERWNQLAYGLGRDQFNEARRQFDVGHDYATRQAQIRVADAKAAGLHPLYALGASANISPTVSGGGFSPGAAPVAGQHPTGSAFDTGIAEAGRAVASWMSKREARAEARRRYLVEDARADELHRSTINMQHARSEADWAEVNLRDALTLKTRFDLMNRIPTPTGAPGGPEKGAIPREQIEAAPYGGSVVTPYGRFRQGQSSPAQRIEDEYGDVAGWLYGAWRLADDVGLNIRRAWENR